MSTLIKSSLVRVLNQRRIIVGAGFLVSQKHIMTCSHVVLEALGIPNQSLKIIAGQLDVDFPFIDANKTFSAKVLVHGLSETDTIVDGVNDIAILELSQPPPANAEPISLTPQGKLWGHDFRVYGFPRNSSAGVWVSGIVRDRLVNGWLQIEAQGQTGYFVSPGFSGSPVWDDQVDDVIGMIVAVERERNTRAAFIIPTDRLLAVVANLTDVQAKLLKPSGGATFNPFEYGSPVSPERFYGRNEQRLDVKNRIGAISSQSLSIVGLRRSGKTSLLRYIKARQSEFCQPNQRPLIIHLDFQSQKYGTPFGILEGFRRGIQAVTGAPPWLNNEESYGVESGLATLRDQGYRTIVLIDEFESITKHLDHFTDWGDDWRAKMSDSLFVSVICSKRSIDEVYAACGLTSPFGNMFATTILGAFEQNEFRELLLDGFERGGRPLSDREMDFIDELSGGLPYYTQMAAALLWQYHDQQKVREKFELQSKHRFLELWDDLTPNERQRIVGIASSESPSPENLRGCKDLILHGLVRPSGALFSSAFAEFVRNQPR